MTSPSSIPQVVAAITLLRPYRSERAPSLGLEMAERIPGMRLQYRVNSETRACTSGIWHCGLSLPKRTGMNWEVGSFIARLLKYCRQIRVRIRLSLGTIMPPKASVKKRKGGKSHTTFPIASQLGHIWRRIDIDDDVPMASATMVSQQSLLLQPSHHPCWLHWRRLHYHDHHYGDYAWGPLRAVPLRHAIGFHPTMLSAVLELGESSHEPDRSSVDVTQVFRIEFGPPPQPPRGRMYHSPCSGYIVPVARPAKGYCLKVRD